MSKNRFSYTQSMKELESIVQEIESGDIDVDILAVKVKRASELIKLCKDNLRDTKKEVEKTLIDMEKEDRPSGE